MIIAAHPRWFVLLAISLVALTVAACQVARQLEPSEWRAYGGDARNTKYSPLAEIDAQNAKELRVAWRWESPDNAIVRTQSGLHLNLFEGTPVALDGNLFVATGLHQVASIDPRGPSGAGLDGAAPARLAIAWLRARHAHVAVRGAGASDLGAILSDRQLV